MRTRIPTLGLATLALLASRGHSQGPPLLAGSFPNVVVPAGNPMTPEKIQLGKALFFEEQLSFDDTMACATCHLPEAGGGDPRAGARAPGDDGLMSTDDDEFGSPAVVRQDRWGNFVFSPAFGAARQATGRNSPSAINAVFFNTQFWDSRAKPEFKDLAGNVVLPEFASLESQSVEPPLSPVEMGHEQRDWSEITAKLARVRPLALASDLPPALDQFIGAETTYGPLFERVFGDRVITRERVAMAIATYERTLVSDQTPFDLGTMTAGQQRGLDVFNRANCATCHTVTNGLFSDGSLQELLFSTNRRFVKVPGLRNVGLRRRFFSSGISTSIALVLQVYQQLGMFTPATGEVGDLRDFLENALTDPRVAARQAPFDRPTLRSERVKPGTNLFGVGTRGTGNVTPVMLADTPPFLGNPGFKIGLGAALGGTRAALVFSTRKAAAGSTLLGVPLAIDPPFAFYRPFIVPHSLPGEGMLTYPIPLPASTAMLGQKFYAQWFVRDPGAAHDISATRAAEFQIFTRP